MKDRKSGQTFLIDSGADLSLVPVLSKSRSRPSQMRLFAANNTFIDTFGEASRILDFGLRRIFPWNFCIADVPYPIIGADFLYHYGLLVDVREGRLVDRKTSISMGGTFTNVAIHSISAIPPNTNCAKILAEFSEITSTSAVSPPKASDVFHHIVTKGPPVAARPRRLPPEKLDSAKAIFRNWCEAGICRPSSSPWASPMHMVRKKDGSWRVCGDFRPLNAITVPDKYPTSHLYDFTAKLHGKKVFSSLDLHMAFNQIPVALEDVEKTAIATPFGLFEFLYMTFGLRNASQTFQRYIDSNLGDLDFVYTYIDDILVSSNSIEEHYEHLRIVFQRLKQAHLRLNVSKCVFAVEELEFLGYSVNSKGIRPTLSRVEHILNFPKPRTVVELRRFIGMINFYHRNLPRAAEIQVPLNAYFKKSRKNDLTEIIWNAEAEQAFEEIRKDLANAALLVHPRAGAELRLLTDASDVAAGAVVEQRSADGTCWEPLAFFSQKFSPAQQKYSAYDRELTAMYLAVKHFLYLLEACEFTIFTDQKPLTYAFLQRPEKASPRQVRQLSFIAEFTTKIKHIAGEENIVADSLSRISAVTLTSAINLENLEKLQNEDEQLQQLMQSNNSFKKVPFDANAAIVCDISGNTIRPYIPPALRREIFDMFHLPAHPGSRATDRVIRKSYVWSNMHRDIARWCKSCVECQQSKVSRHNRLLPEHFTIPDGRFEHVHIDIVGPLPEKHGFRYLVTMIDRFSRWIEVIPTKDIEAMTVARVFFDNWISRYGVPKHLTSDQGSQFNTSRLFQSLLHVVGCQRIRTTPYHPQANGLVERMHRQLKSALMCQKDSDWTRNLSSVLLGLRTYVREDTDASPAELVFGTTLRIPGEFVGEEDFLPDPIFFLDEFKTYMRQVRPVPVSHHLKRGKRPFHYKDLYSCSHVFLRRMAKSSLERPYTGPHKVVKRVSDRVFEIEVNGVPRSVNVELLKPAHFLASNENTECLSPGVTRSQSPVHIAQNIEAPPAVENASGGATAEKRAVAPLRTYFNRRKRLEQEKLKNNLRLAQDNCSSNVPQSESNSKTNDKDSPFASLLQENVISLDRRKLKRISFNNQISVATM